MYNFLLISCIISIFINNVSASFEKFKIFENFKAEIMTKYLDIVKKELLKEGSKMSPPCYWTDEGLPLEGFFDLESKEIMDGFSQDSDDFFLLLIFFYFNSSKFPVFPYHRSLEWARSMDMFQTDLIKQVIRNIKKFILICLYLSKNDNEKREFLDSVDLFYQNRLYKLILHIDSDRIKEKDYSSFKITKDFESSLRDYHTLIEEDPEVKILREFARFKVDFAKNPKTRPSENLSCLFFYCSLNGRNSKSIRWLAYQEELFLFFYFLFHRQPFIYEDMPIDLFDAAVESLFQFFEYSNFDIYLVEEHYVIQVWIEDKNLIPAEIADHLSTDELEELILTIITKLYTIERFYIR
jgi:hypothetical protein